MKAKTTLKSWSPKRAALATSVRRQILLNSHKQDIEEQTNRFRGLRFGYNATVSFDRLTEMV
jgi:hypothetical protein